MKVKDKNKEVNIITLRYGYLLKFLHENIPTFQLSETNPKSKTRWNNLLKFFEVFEYYVDNLIFENYYISKKTKEKIGAYREDAQEYLNMNFYESDYKKDVEPRSYWLKIFLKEIIKDFFKENINTLTDDLSVDYEVPDKVKEVNYYRNIKFIDSKYYDKKSIDIDEYLLEYPYQFSRKYSALTHIDKDFFNTLRTSHILLTNKSSYKKTFNKTNIEYKNLKSHENDLVYTFDFKKTRKKIKKNNSKTILRKYKHSKMTINNTELKNRILKLIDSDDILLILPLIKILKYYKDNDNYIIYEKKSHRYYAISDLNYGYNLQGMRKRFRNILFDGYYDYDINAGAPTLLYQYVKKLYPNENIKLKALESYIKDRSKIRNRCCEILEENKVKEYKKGELKRNVKAVITAVLYGADIFNEKSKMELSLENREYLYDNYDDFRFLIDDLNCLNSYYKKYIRKQRKNERVIKVYDEKIDLGEGNKTIKITTITSYIYYCLESKVLDLVSNKYKDNISLLIHDGFISHLDIDVKELEKSVKNELGFDVKYSKEKI